MCFSQAEMTFYESMGDTCEIDAFGTSYWLTTSLREIRLYNVTFANISTGTQGVHNVATSTEVWIEVSQGDLILSRSRAHLA